jgi:hypothetical protein
MASTLIHNARIFDEEEVLSQNGYLLLGDGVIKSIGSELTGKLPAADIVIDGEVCTHTLHKTSSPHILIYDSYPQFHSSKANLTYTGQHPPPRPYRRTRPRPRRRP